MDLILSIPLPVRLPLVFLLGAFLGSAVNVAIYRLSWLPRPISPWSRPHPSAPPRYLLDRLPVLGWLGLRREAGLHGAGFWGRPMLLELLAGVGLAVLYWWEIVAGGLLPAGAPHDAASTSLILHLEFAAHAILATLMLAASMIDVDEKIIPDAITIPGTLAGLLFAAALPRSLLPDPIPLEGGRFVLGFLHLAAPNVWPPRLGGFPQGESLALALGCWWLWCVALLPRSWRSRHGWRRAAQLCWARIVRRSEAHRILLMAVLGSLAIVAVWYYAQLGWIGLLSALVGMAAGGVLVWLVRIVGSAALGQEAMGFGDVTLMAMIGAFLGWQPCLVIFFLAPFAGLIVGVSRLILFRDKEMPYGPFLCLAALFTIVCWQGVWERTLGVFSLGWIVPLLMLGCLAMMGLMLAVWRLIVGTFRQ